MITSIRNADYSFLFEEAGKELLRLDAAHKLSVPLQDAEKEELQAFGRFSSLEKYFTRLGDLVAHCDNYIKYIMLPLDEPCLEVDANTRIITIPDGFKKYGAGVQGDTIAETLFLRIDRFFDAMDFMMTEPFIQWKLKDGTEGATPIPYMDYESEHNIGKLILVWPLSGAVTSQEGPVQFSLRFLKRDGDTVVYSWNSVTATINIKQALNPKVDYAELDEAAALYKRAIANSQHTSDSDKIEPPSFDAPGYSIGFDKDTIHLDATNSLTLAGQAWIDGQGHLSYEWQFVDLDGIPALTGVNVAGAVANSFKITNDENPVEKKVYYVKDDSATPYGYRELKHDDFKTTEEDIYERYAIYRITPDVSPMGDGTVTGVYRLVAKHKLGFPIANKELMVTIPGPETLEFTSGDKDKNEKSLGLNEEKNLLKDDKDLELSVAIENDNAPEGAYQSMTYLWKKNTANDSEEGMTDVVTHVYNNGNNVGKKTDTLSLTDAEPGWYKVYVTSMLNRDTISVESNVARVTKAPQPPVLKYPASSEFSKQLEASAFPNRLVEIEIEHNAFNNPIELHSDDLIYEWYDEDKLLTTDTPGISFDENKLLIDGTKVTNDIMIIHCYVTNKLNGVYSTERAHSGNFVVSF